MRTHGFTLLELSIVIVIIALIAGGVTIAQNLIRNAQVQGVSKEYGTYVNAIKTFQDKYNALPGDFAKAGVYLRDATAFDGDGDGRIEEDIEDYQSWLHLSRADLVEGNYPGFSTSNKRRPYPTDGEPQNIPASQLSGAGWEIIYHDISNPILLYNNGDTLPRHVLILGGITLNAGTQEMDPVLTPEEAELIDLKLDDGMPGFGKIVAQDNSITTTTCQDSDGASAYNVSERSKLCVIAFKTGF